MPATTIAPRPRWIQVLEYTAVLCCAVLAADYLRTARAPEQWLVLAAAVPAGYVLADLCSGLVHWFGDTFFEEDTLNAQKVGSCNKFKKMKYLCNRRVFVRNPDTSKEIVHFIHEVQAVFAITLSTFLHMICGSNDDTMPTFNLFRVHL
jgi:hypothetical protein